jgi:four helix bundle protein
MFRNYEEWLTHVPQQIQSDPLWSFVTYRKALFLSDLAWFDSEKFLSDSRGNGLAWQLVNSAGSVPANIEEGYGRGYGKDYARFLRIALGSAREAKG